MEAIKLVIANETNAGILKNVQITKTRRGIQELT
jgi:hypothetical protein